jgi:hypothetical protein
MVVGPEWLSLEESEWPTVLEVAPPPAEPEPADHELDGAELMRRPGAIVMAVKAGPEASESANRRLSVEYSRFSHYPRLVRTVAFALRWKDKPRKGEAPGKVTAEPRAVTAEEWARAEICLYRTHQREEPYDPRHMKDWRVVMDDRGLLRIASRLRHVSEDMAIPILLNHQSGLTALLVRWIHAEAKHAGVDATMSAFLSRFWTRQARSTVRKALKECLVCWKEKARPYRYPKAPPLPSARLEASRLFEKVGIDFLGPRVVRTEDGGRKKIWVLLVTCLSTRAGYLELLG